MLPASLLQSCVRVSSAAVHFGTDWLLQSTLLIALGLLAARLFRPKGAAVQSLVYRMTLAAVLACPAVSLLLGAAGIRGLNVNLVADAPAAASRTSYGTVNDATAASDAPALRSGLRFSERSEFQHGAAQAAAGPAVANQPDAPEDGLRRVSAEQTVPASHWPAWCVLLAAAWLAGSGALAMRLLLGWRSARQLCLSACPAEPRAAEDCRQLAARMGIRSPRVVRSGFAASPSLVGVFRPVVVLPEERDLPAEDQEVLAHELAHLARGDQAWSLAGHLGTALLFYQPLVWLLVRRMALAAEEVCDDCVINLGFNRKVYAQRLVDVAERYQPAPAFAVGMVSRRFRVSRRVARILDSSRQLATHAGRRARVCIATAGLLAAILAGAISAGDRAAAAQGPQADQSAGAPGASQADDVADTAYMIEKASAVVVMRPAAGLARSELAPLASFVERLGNDQELRLTDVRQITLIRPADPIPSGPIEIEVLQWVKPVAKDRLDKRLSGKKYTVKERNGKKVYIEGGGALALCDDHTVVGAGSEQAMDVYLAGHLGVLPKWLPAKAWESFRKDHLMMAADTAMMRPEMKTLTDSGSPPIVRAALLPISSLYYNATMLAAGMKLDDALAVHAWATGKSAASSENLRRTAEALKTLAESLVKSFQEQDPSGRRSRGNALATLLDDAGRLLQNMKLRKDGNDVQLQGSIEMDKARLAALVSAIVATTAPPDPSTDSGMKELVEDFFHHNWRDVTSRETIEWGHAAKTKDGNFSIRYKYRASYWWGKPTIVNQVFTFDRRGEFVSAVDAEKRTLPPAKVYKINKKVSDFPNREDMSTPEAAYATIHRVWAAEGAAAWPRLVVPWQAAHTPSGPKRPLPKEAADRLLGTTILEVHLWDATHAVVLARKESGATGHTHVDMRWLDRVDGRWLNQSNDSRPTIEEARKKVEQSRLH